MGEGCDPLVSSFNPTLFGTKVRISPFHIPVIIATYSVVNPEGPEEGEEELRFLWCLATEQTLGDTSKRKSERSPEVKKEKFIQDTSPLVQAEVFGLFGCLIREQSSLLAEKA